MLKKTICIIAVTFISSWLISCGIGKPKNLALKNKADSSSFETIAVYHQTTGLTPDLAVDGDSETRWQSSFKYAKKPENAWFSIDLGKKNRIKLIKILWSKNCAEMFSIEVSDDAKTWKEISQIHINKNELKNNDYWSTVELAKPVKARYVKMVGNKPATKYGYSVHEFEVY